MPSNFPTFEGMRHWETPFGPVYAGDQALQAFDTWLETHRASYSQVLILTDESVHVACIPYVLGSLAHLGESSILEVEAGEASKSLEVMNHLWMALLENGADRQSLLISIGGGVVTDLGGFLAATYMRGLDHVLIPTSLLGMVDAAMGGKTGINVGGFKNLAGTFSASRGIYADPKLLQTLPEAHWRAGWAECVKHAYLQGAPLWQQIQSITDLSHVVDFLPALMEAKITRIQSDPRESGLARKALNLGHSVGHAAEAGMGTGLLHGDAVALGLWIEFHIAQSMGLCSAIHMSEMQVLIDRWWPNHWVLPKDVSERLRGDKKNHAGAIRMALPGAPGAPVTLTEVSAIHLQSALAAYASH